MYKIKKTATFGSRRRVPAPGAGLVKKIPPYQSGPHKPPPFLPKPSSSSLQTQTLVVWQLQFIWNILEK